MPNLSDENPASAFCCFSLIPAKRMRPFFSLSAPNLHILSLKLCTLNISPLCCARRYLNLGKLNTLIPILRQIWVQTQELFNFLIWERAWAKVREAETTLNCETTLVPTFSPPPRPPSRNPLRNLTTSHPHPPFSWVQSLWIFTSSMLPVKYLTALLQNINSKSYCLQFRI